MVGGALEIAKGDCAIKRAKDVGVKGTASKEVTARG